MKSSDPMRDLNERLANKRFNWLLPQLIYRNGVLCDLFRSDKDTDESDVYGQYSGQDVEDNYTTTTLIAGLPIDSFRSSGNGYHGQNYFTDSNACYAEKEDIMEGDIIRPHGTDITFVINNVEAAGLDGKCRRFNISSIQPGMRPDQHNYPKKLIIQ